MKSCGESAAGVAAGTIDVVCNFSLCRRRNLSDLLTSGPSKAIGRGFFVVALFNRDAVRGCSYICPVGKACRGRFGSLLLGEVDGASKGTAVMALGEVLSLRIGSPPLLASKFGPGGEVGPCLST